MLQDINSFFFCLLFDLCFEFSLLQFVMFYACALDPVNCGEEFATNLVEIFVYDANLTCLR